MCKYGKLYPVIGKWKKLTPEIRNSTLNFRKSLTSFIKGLGNPTFSIHNHVNFKLLIRLRLDFTYLGESKFRYNFQGTLNF